MHKGQSDLLLSTVSTKITLDLDNWIDKYWPDTYMREDVHACDVHVDVYVHACTSCTHVFMCMGVISVDLHAVC